MAHLLAPYLAAGFPAVAVTTHEEERFVRSICGEWPDLPVFTVAGAGGLRDARTDKAIEPRFGYSDALNWLAERQDTILVMFDWENVVRNAGAYRALKLVMPALKSRGCMAVCSGPGWALPPQLIHDMPVLRFVLPTREELGASLDVITSNPDLEPVTAEQRAMCLDSLTGLGAQEAENAASIAAAKTGRADPAIMQEEKLALIRSSGYLEVFPTLGMADVGGLGGIKDYFIREVLPAKDDTQLAVRGMLLAGIPGTGKTHTGKAAGGILGWPVIRWDLTACKASHVGESEANARDAISKIEAVSPAVVVIDEVEKAVAGAATSGDSGVSSGLLQIILVWLAEHRKQILTIMTCNDYSRLPAELTRSGRMDTTWFVDLPTAAERAEIAAIHLARFGCEIDGLPATIAANSAGFSGAEIEGAIKSAARITQRKIDHEAAIAACAATKPLSKSKAAEIKALRDWAATGLRIANSPEVEAIGPVRRVAVSRG